MNRREFVKNAGIISASTLALYNSKVFAAGSEKIKIAVIGCGGRGKTVIYDLQKATKYIGIQLEIVALADYFKDKALALAQENGVSEDRILVGPTSYKDVMKTDADIVCLMTPPLFRPVHLEAAINAGKHVFMEKPGAVDAPGARKIMEIGELAKQKGLSIVAGTQRRYDFGYRKAQYAVEKGLIGSIRGGSVYYLDPSLGYFERKPGEEDASYMIRNWYNFMEMSGDHIVEQHVHNIDVANWFIGRHPISALGVGGRARRKTGNLYDFFSVDFDYGDDIRIHSMCRQMDGAYTRISEILTGTKGQIYADGSGMDEIPSEFQMPEVPHHENPYAQEQVELINSVREGKPLIKTHEVATATLSAIMGRTSAYTGQLVRWKDLTENTNSPWYNMAVSPTPEDFENGTVKAPDHVIPIPGKDPSART